MHLLDTSPECIRAKEIRAVQMRAQHLPTARPRRNAERSAARNDENLTYSASAIDSRTTGRCASAGCLKWSD
jgi:hypothetical protein